MTRPRGPVSELFHEMVAEGHIRPVERMEEMRLPGELTVHHTFTTYSTPSLPPRIGADTHAQLGQHPQGNLSGPSGLFRIGIR